MFSTVADIQYSGEASWSTVGDIQYSGGRHHDCRGGYSVQSGDTMMTAVGYHDCSGETSRHSKDSRYANMFRYSVLKLASKYSLALHLPQQNYA